MNNNIPNWAPRHPMVVTDAGKLSKFWQAQTIRAGITHSAGALRGLGDVDFDSGTPTRTANFEPTYITGVAGDEQKAGASLQPVSSFLTSLSNTVQGLAAKLPFTVTAPNPQTGAPQVPWWQVGLGAVAAVVVGRWVWKRVK